MKELSFYIKFSPLKHAHATLHDVVTCVHLHWIQTIIYILYS